MAIRRDDVLLSAQTADGNGTAVEWHGGRGVYSVWGALGGGTAKLQWSPDEKTTWFDVDASGDTFVTLAAAGAGGFELPPGWLRAVVSGSTGANINAVVSSSR